MGTPAFNLHAFRAAQRAAPLSDFARELFAGLSLGARSISPKFFYDVAGSALFDRICELPEYYPTRTEVRILTECADEIAAQIGPNAEIVEFGAGSLTKVRLLLDALGSKRIGRQFMAPMQAAGVHVALFHETRIGRRLRPVTNYRTHRKIVVCDGRVGFTGGVNITDAEDARTRADAYHDVHLRIEGSAVRWLQTTFLEDWTYATGEDPRQIDHALPLLLPDQPVGEAAGEIPVQIVTSGPDNPLEAIHRMHLAAIQSSERRAWLTTPYFVPGEPALMALTSAALRGVYVRLLVPRRSDSLVVSAAARSYYDELIAAGVKVWEYKARMLHSKTLVVDDHCAMIGTANFDNRSFRLNFEVMAVIYGTTLAEPLAAQFETDLRSASPIRAYRRQKFLRRLADATARLFSPLL